MNYTKPLKAEPNKRADDSIMLECLNINKSYGGLKAVQNVTFAVKRQSLTSIVGPSGCGKTTALRLIAGLEVPDSGSLTIDSITVSNNKTFVPPEKRSVGLVFQDYALFSHMTVHQNVAYGLDRPASESDRVSTVMELVRIQQLGNRYPHELSGGEQQRVALARALAPNPKLILLDEPFSNLDAALRTKVRAEVKQILIESGITSIIVTHDQDEALSLADQTGVMFNGQIEQIGSPEEVYKTPASLQVATFLGNANVLLGEGGNKVVECELGRLKTNSSLKGPVHITIQPELIHTESADSASSHGQVIEREFYGHDQVIVIRLNSGQIINSRCGSELIIQPGQQVAISLLGPVSVFPVGQRDIS